MKVLLQSGLTKSLVGTTIAPPKEKPATKPARHPIKQPRPQPIERPGTSPCPGKPLRGPCPFN